MKKDENLTIKRLTLNGLHMPCFTNETGCLRKEILKRIVDELNKW